MGALMIITAACIDIFEALLDLLVIGEFLSPIISICADLVFWIWFKILGVSFTKNPKNFAVMGMQALVGLMPGVDALPELTLGVLTIVILTRSEDKGGLLAKTAGIAGNTLAAKNMMRRGAGSVKETQPATSKPNLNTTRNSPQLSSKPATSNPSGTAPSQISKTAPASPAQPQGSASKPNGTPAPHTDASNLVESDYRPDWFASMQKGQAEGAKMASQGIQQHGEGIEKSRERMNKLGMDGSTHSQASQWEINNIKNKQNRPQNNTSKGSGAFGVDTMRDKSKD